MSHGAQLSIGIWLDIGGQFRASNERSCNGASYLFLIGEIDVCNVGPDPIEPLLFWRSRLRGMGDVETRILDS